MAKVVHHHRDWEIRFDPTRDPAEIFQFNHVDYDEDPHALGTRRNGFGISDPRWGTAASLTDAVEIIDQIQDEFEDDQLVRDIARFGSYRAAMGDY